MFPEEWTNQSGTGSNEMDYIGSDEQRRQQALDSWNNGVSNLINSDDAADQDLNSGDTHASMKPDNAQLTPAEQKYQTLLSQQPQQANYKPSVLRRIGAALAGAGAGWRNPAQGVQVAAQIKNAPYQRAEDAWQQQVQAAQGGLKLDEQIQNRQNQAQRAQASTMNAQARINAAKSLDQQRQWSQANAPWHPHSEQEQIEVEKAKLQPHNPTAFEEWSANPDKYDDYLTAQQNRSTAETAAEREKLENIRQDAENKREGMRQGGETSREQMRINNQNHQPRIPTPGESKVIDQQSIQRLLTFHPEYSKFVKNGAPIDPGDLPKNHWYNTTTDAQESLARTQYQQFMSELDKARGQMTGQKGSGGSWDIQRND